MEIKFIHFLTQSNSNTMAAMQALQFVFNNFSWVDVKYVL